MISIFIPIRKGSKRIKNKNLKSLPYLKFGLTELKLIHLKKFRNLIRKSNYFNLKKFEIIVSTNCDKVKFFLKPYNWIKLHNRNSKLSSDDSIDELIREVPKICSGKFILWTHVTSPLFDEYNYYNFLKRFFQVRKSKKVLSAFSADKVQKFLYSKRKKWISHNTSKRKWPRTQDLNELYSVNSGAFIASRSVYLKLNDRLCNAPFPIVSDSSQQSGFDIDNLEDFNTLKEKILYEKKFKFLQRL
tara:strand:- start:425 stop:1159 length:735 start_codon:yes stop_codon:yes gene_type:complete